MKTTFSALLMVVTAGSLMMGCATQVGEGEGSDPSDEEVAQADEQELSTDEGAGGSHSLPDLEYDEATSSGGTDGFPNVTTPYGKGSFTSYGDSFNVSDGSADGMSVAVRWRVFDKFGHILRRGLCRNVAGSSAGARSCNKDLPEGLRLQMRIGRCNGTKYSCHTFLGYQDWTDWRNGAT